jgi:hypothetical protein
MEYEEFVKATIKPLIGILHTPLVHPYEYRPPSLVHGLSAAEAQYVQGARHVIE